MKTTLRDFVDGKADLAFGHYGISRPIYALGQRDGWSDPKEMESAGTPEGASKGWDSRGRGKKTAEVVNGIKNSLQEKGHRVHAFKSYRHDDGTDRVIIVKYHRNEHPMVNNWISDVHHEVHSRGGVVEKVTKDPYDPYDSIDDILPENNK